LLKICFKILSKCLKNSRLTLVLATYPTSIQIAPKLEKLIQKKNYVK
jgi:hypothetical protein